MAKDTKIEWCDHTFNPWSGCTKVSPGCAHCYAEALAKRAPKTLGGWGKGVPRRRTSAEYWRQPLKWDREAAHKEMTNEGYGQPYRRPRIFCASLADWLDEEVPVEWLSDLLSLIFQTPNLDWLLLSKRPLNWKHRMLHAGMYMAGYRDGQESENPTAKPLPGWEMVWDWVRNLVPPANVWMGTTVEDQTHADERIPLLLEIPSRVRFLSCEPLLGPVDFDKIGMNPLWGGTPGGEKIHWVICGGESGPGARPMHPDWAKSLRDQCAAAGVAFFFKQWGGHAPGFDEDRYAHCGKEEKPHVWLTRDGQQSGFCWIVDDDGTWSNWTGEPPIDADGELREDVVVMHPCKKGDAGRLLDGGEHNAFPEVQP